MDKPGFECVPLRGTRVAIWGLGLMGGSLALALQGKCAGLTGIDVDPETVGMARERGIVQLATLDPAEGLCGVDLVILAAPVRAILGQIEDLPRFCPQDAVVIDLGSTKQQISQAMERLPQRFDPVGGHPMCGKEKSSLNNAEAEIFQGAPFALVSLPRTSARGRELAQQVALAAGAQPLWIDAAEHDRWVAASSHVPFLAASALTRVTPAEVRPLIGPGFRSTARLAASSARMMIDILATNPENVRMALQQLEAALAEYETLLDQGEYEKLVELFNEGAQRYHALTDL